MADREAPPVALIVDDEADIRELLGMTLEQMEVDVRAAPDVGTAMDCLGRDTVDFCLTDMRLPDGDGIELVRHVQHHYPDIPIAVITAYGSMERAVEALKAGAFDFVSKPIDLEVLRRLTRSALKLGSRPPRRAMPLRLIGESEPITETRRLIDKVARSQAPVYITGESGTGKELAARLIHWSSPRAEQPFVPVNCAAIPPELMESEFFGHRRGSFTGANQDKAGLFQAAEGGTLFLDEVGELPAPIQVKLLRAIQERAVRPVGANAETPVDVRLLSATHQNLGELVRSGDFRQDLFYRINVIKLTVPPLRERREDLPLLVSHFLNEIRERDGHSQLSVSDEAMAVLRDYHFPGNVRELENVLQRAAALCDGYVIQPEDLGLSAGQHAVQPADDPAEQGGLAPYLDSMEKQAILEALEATRYNKTAAARRLGLTFRQLRYRLKKLGLE